MPTENKLSLSLPEVKRWQLKGFIPGIEGESKAVFRPVVVLADDFDRIAAERDALQLRLNAADQRIDELGGDKARIDWLAEQPVDTLYLDDGRIIDIAGRIDLRDAIDAAIEMPVAKEACDD